VQYVLDLHSKFALRPHQVRKYGRKKDRKKKERKKKKPPDENIMSASATQGGHTKL